MPCKVGRTYDINNVTCRSCERQNAMVCKGLLSARANKFNARRIEVDGIRFDSKKEAARWHQLQLMKKAGLISDLQRQVAFELQPAVVVDGRKKPALRYVADFTYKEKGTLVVEDVKSKATKKLPAYRIKKHLMMAIHNIEVREA